MGRKPQSDTTAPRGQRHDCRAIDVCQNFRSRSAGKISAMIKRYVWVAAASCFVVGFAVGNAAASIAGRGESPTAPMRTKDDSRRIIRGNWPPRIASQSKPMPSVINRSENSSDECRLTNSDGLVCDDADRSKVAAPSAARRPTEEGL